MLTEFRARPISADLYSPHQDFTTTGCTKMESHFNLRMIPSNTDECLMFVMKSYSVRNENFSQIIFPHINHTILRKKSFWTEQPQYEYNQSDITGYHSFKTYFNRRHKENSVFHAKRLNSQKKINNFYSQSILVDGLH